MGMHFSKIKKKVFIDWDEKKKEGVEHWHGDFTPINVFYHPKRNELLRVTLKGKMPKWVERFASSIKFKFGITSDDDGKPGFWLANWNAWEVGEKPISAPNLDGAIHQFSKKIPDEFKGIKEKIRNNREIIKENLQKNPKFFEDIGVYYKSEEIEGIKGTLLIDNDIFLDKDELTDEEYARLLEADGRLEKVVWELTTPVPEPVEQVESIDDDEETEEEVFDEDDLIFEEDELLEDLLEEDMIEEEIENEDFLLDEDNDEFIEDDLISEEIPEIHLDDDALSSDIYDSELLNTEEDTLENELVKEDEPTVESVPEDIEPFVQPQEIPEQEEVIPKFDEPVTSVSEPAETESSSSTKTIIIDLEQERVVKQTKKPKKKKIEAQETIPLF